MTGKNNGLPSRQNLIDAISRVDFYSFVQRIFPIVSAGSPFLPNWHVEAITYALTRVMRGEIKRLIITVPPRSLKSHLRLRCFSRLRARPRPDKTHHLRSATPKD